jgi:hypothetical protein
MKDYYVYLILDPNEDYSLSINDVSIYKKPFYVGYGKNNRMEQHLLKREMNRKCFKSCKVKSILSGGKLPIFIKLVENLTFEDANNSEIYYIEMFGRIDNNTGILTNHTDGGKGTKNKILSIETKNKISNSKIGIKHTEESKIKISISHIGKKLSDETKNKISNSMKGDSNPFYGKKHNLDSFKNCKVTLQIDIETEKIISRFNSVTERTRNV